MLRSGGWMLQVPIMDAPDEEPGLPLYRTSRLSPPRVWAPETRCHHPQVLREPSLGATSGRVSVSHHVCQPTSLILSLDNHVRGRKVHSGPDM